MKFMIMTAFAAEKAADIAAASDKIWAAQPRGRRPEKGYVLMSALSEVPPNSMVSFYVSEEDSTDEVAARTYPVTLAGASINVIPLMEFPLGAAAKTEKKLKR